MEFRDVRLCGGGKLVPARCCAGLGERSFIMLVTVLVANSCQGLPETWGKVLKVVTHGVGDRPSGSGPLRRDTGSG